MLPDIDQYLPYLDDLDISCKQKEEIIYIVWELMDSQVKQAFDNHINQTNGDEFKNINNGRS